jgi:hypothetical protein
MIIIEIRILSNQRTYHFKFNAKYDWFKHVTNLKKKEKHKSNDGFKNCSKIAY